jgi:hypothetical protein
VAVEAPDNLIGGTTTGAGNVISGNSNYGIELLHNFTGVTPGDSNGGNVVEGNRIGTNAAGTAALPNFDGVVINGAVQDTIGGTVAGAGNLISGNTNNGIDLVGLVGSSFGTGNSLIQGNYIGTNAAGTAALPNYNGIHAEGLNGAANVSSNTIGGIAGPLGDLQYGGGNVISGNTHYGIELVGGPEGDGTEGNLIQGNYIGTNAAGDAALPNLAGVFINGSDYNTVGGTVFNADSFGGGNLISGNTLYGIVIANASATHNTVMLNSIGLNAAGKAALPNGVGIEILNSGGNTIGTSTLISPFPRLTFVTAGNVISGNTWYGVQISGNPVGANVRVVGNVVEGNVIGLSANHSNAIPNKVGVYVQNASSNTIGGTAANTSNVIAENGWGVRVDGGTGNAILGNAIFGNSVLNIQLLNGGNNSQVAPVLSEATNSGGITTVSASLYAAPNTTYTVEFFWKTTIHLPESQVESMTFVARFQVTTNAFGFNTFSIPLPLSIAAGDFVSATVTDPNGNTSQFSNWVQVQ